MAQILPFCGWRYDLSQIGASQTCWHPPQHPSAPSFIGPSVIAIPATQSDSSIYSRNPVILMNWNARERAAALFRLWRREGILVREHDDAFYAIQLLHSGPTGDYERWSVLGLVRPKSPPAKLSAPHAPPIRPKCKSSKPCSCDWLPKATLSPSPPSRSIAIPIQGYRSPNFCNCSFASRLRWNAGTTTAFAGDSGQLPPAQAVSRIHNHLAQAQILAIAGADQLQATLRQQQLLARSEQPPGPRDPATCSLICITGADDPGMPIQPAVFQFPAGYPETGAELRYRAEQVLGLVCRFSGNEADASADAIELAAINDEQPCFAVGTPDGEWHLLSAPARCRTATELLELTRQELSFVSRSAAYPAHGCCR
ncbi:MAG UNVERIFIED_CONTAM: DUF1015 domain-containing protein [Planctomycetaceae bacterium]